FRTLDGTLAVGAYSVLVFLTQRLLWPFTGLGETVDLYQRSMASVERLLNLLALKREPQVTREGQTMVPSSTYRGDIEYADVRFRYSPEQPVLHGLSLRIPGGRFVGLVGSTGSGKSTVIKMLLQFYRPDSGEIRLGGRPLDSLFVDELRRHIAWVGQETFLFHGTIHEN